MYYRSNLSTQCQVGDVAQVFVGADEDAFKSQLAFNEFSKRQLNLPTNRNPDVAPCERKQSTTELHRGIGSHEVDYDSGAIDVSVEFIRM